MPDLTLDRVQAAGRFAWHDEALAVYVPGVGLFAFRTNAGGDPTGEGETLTASECLSWEQGAAEMLSAHVSDDPRYEHRWRIAHWHHIDGCDCEFCT